MPRTLHKFSSPTPLEPSVKRLAAQIQRVLTQARAKAEAAVGKISTRAYWQAGKFIEKNILQNKNRAGYGENLFLQLSGILRLSTTLLYDAHRFYKATPILRTSVKLTWSHQLALLQIENPDEKRLLEKSAEKSNWSVSELEKQIQKIKQTRRPKPSAPSPFKPRRGRLSTWLVRLPTQNSETPALDLGFYTFRELSPAELSLYKEGAIVTLSGGRLKISEAAKNQLYTYEAELERVVDGDTLWVKIFLGFGIVARKKLRLRGIDCPELDTPAGKRAKKFVDDFFSLESWETSREKKIKKDSSSAEDFSLKTPSSKQFLVTTTKPDKYDRYLSDIWIGEQNLSALLLANGHARLKTSYVPKDWKE